MYLITKTATLYTTNCTASPLDRHAAAEAVPATYDRYRTINKLLQHSCKRRKYRVHVDLFDS